MHFPQNAWAYLAALALLLAVAPVSHAQLNSNIANVNLNAVLGESLTVVASPGTVNFTLAPNGPINGSAPVAIQTQWALATGRTNVSLYVYFATATALTDGVDNIPTTAVAGSVNGGAFAAITAASPFSANSEQVFSQALTPATLNATRNDTVTLRIDTTGLGLPAATYTGVLNVRAQAI